MGLREFSLKRLVICVLQMTCLLFMVWSGNGSIKGEKKEKIKMGQKEDRILS